MDFRRNYPIHRKQPSIQDIQHYPDNKVSQNHLHLTPQQNPYNHHHASRLRLDNMNQSMISQPLKDLTPGPSDSISRSIEQGRPQRTGVSHGRHQATYINPKLLPHGSISNFGNVQGLNYTHSPYSKDSIAQSATRMTTIDTSGFAQPRETIQVVGDYDQTRKGYFNGSFGGGLPQYMSDFDDFPRTRKQHDFNHPDLVAQTPPLYSQLGTIEANYPSFKVSQSHKVSKFEPHKFIESPRAYNDSTGDYQSTQRQQSSGIESKRSIMAKSAFQSDYFGGEESVLRTPPGGSILGTRTPSYTIPGGQASDDEINYYLIRFWDVKYQRKTQVDFESFQRDLFEYMKLVGQLDKGVEILMLLRKLLTSQNMETISRDQYKNILGIKFSQKTTPRQALERQNISNGGGAAAFPQQLQQQQQQPSNRTLDQDLQWCQHLSLPSAGSAERQSTIAFSNQENIGDFKQMQERQKRKQKKRRDKRKVPGKILAADEQHHQKEHPLRKSKEFQEDYQNRSHSYIPDKSNVILIDEQKRKKKKRKLNATSHPAKIAPFGGKALQTLTPYIPHQQQLVLDNDAEGENDKDQFQDKKRDNSLEKDILNIQIFNSFHESPIKPSGGLNTQQSLPELVRQRSTSPDLIPSTSAAAAAAAGGVIVIDEKYNQVITKINESQVQKVVQQFAATQPKVSSRMKSKIVCDTMNWMAKKYWFVQLKHIVRHYPKKADIPLQLAQKETQEDTSSFLEQQHHPTSSDDLSRNQYKREMRTLNSKSFTQLQMKLQEVQSKRDQQEGQFNTKISTLQSENDEAQNKINTQKNQIQTLISQVEHLISREANYLQEKQKLTMDLLEARENSRQMKDQYERTLMGKSGAIKDIINTSNKSKSLVLYLTLSKLTLSQNSSSKSQSFKILKENYVLEKETIKRFANLIENKYLISKCQSFQKISDHQADKTYNPFSKLIKIFKSKSTLKTTRQYQKAFLLLKLNSVQSILSQVNYTHYHMKLLTQLVKRNDIRQKKDALAYWRFTAKYKKRVQLGLRALMRRDQRELYNFKVRYFKFWQFHVVIYDKVAQIQQNTQESVFTKDELNFSQRSTRGITPNEQFLSQNTRPVYEEDRLSGSMNDMFNSYAQQQQQNNRFRKNSFSPNRFLQTPNSITAAQTSFAQTKSSLLEGLGKDMYPPSANKGTKFMSPNLHQRSRSRVSYGKFFSFEGQDEPDMMIEGGGTFDQREFSNQSQSSQDHVKFLKEKLFLRFERAEKQLNYIEEARMISDLWNRWKFLTFEVALSTIPEDNSSFLMQKYKSKEPQVYERMTTEEEYQNYDQLFDGEQIASSSNSAGFYPSDSNPYVGQQAQKQNINKIFDSAISEVQIGGGGLKGIQNSFRNKLHESMHKQQQQQQTLESNHIDSNKSSNQNLFLMRNSENSSYEQKLSKEGSMEGFSSNGNQCNLGGVPVKDEFTFRRGENLNSGSIGTHSRSGSRKKWGGEFLKVRHSSENHDMDRFQTFGVSSKDQTPSLQEIDYKKTSIHSQIPNSIPSMHSMHSRISSQSMPRQGSIVNKQNYLRETGEYQGDREDYRTSEEAEEQYLQNQKYQRMMNQENDSITPRSNELREAMQYFKEYL